MSNPLYWEDHVSSTYGGQTEMIVDQHAPSFTVQWGKGKYDDVVADHSNLTGSGRYGRCPTCERDASLTVFGICLPCERTLHADEQRRMQQDLPMGSNKRSTPIARSRA